MKKFLVLAVLNLFSIALLAQGGSSGMGGEMPKVGVVKGNVVEDENNKPLEYANVILYHARDSSMVDGTISNPDGTFQISNLPFGRFYLVANFIGFEKSIIDEVRISPDQRSVEVGTIKLHQAAQQLESVEITGERSTVEYHIDKKVVNVGQDLIAAGGTVANALENVPSVRVDIEGNVTLRGSSNFTVFVNGRPSVLKGSDALQQIPANAVESIEIITNPSAKYDPDGIGGIINVIMKKNVKSGLNGIINASIGTGDKYSIDGLFNYKVGKFNFFAGANYNDQKYEMIRKVNQATIYENDSSIFVNSRITGGMNREGYDLKAGFDYSFTDNKVLSFSGNYGYFGFGGTSLSRELTYSNPFYGNKYSIYESDALRDGNFYSFNLNYQNKFDDNGHELTTQSFFSYQEGDDYENTDEFIANEEWEKVGSIPNQINTNEAGSSNEFRIQTDYVKPITNGKFEAGLQYRLDTDQEDYNFLEFDSELNQWVPNDLFSTRSEFQRNIYAGYGIFSNKLFGFEYQLGLRGEYTDRLVHTASDNKNYVIDRIDLFPSVHISKEISESDQIQGGYSRRINRPRGYFLEPFISYQSSTMYRQGNPDLQPEYVNSYELNYQKRFGISFVSLETYYRETKNAFTRIISMYDAANNIKIMRFGNANEETSLGAELMVNWEITNWLKVNGSTNYYRYKVDGATEQGAMRESNNMDFRLNTDIKLFPTTRLQLVSFYNGPSATAQGEREGFAMFSAALRQDFFDNKLSATLQAQNLFGAMKFKINSYQDNANGPDLVTNYQFEREPNVFMLTLSYKINNYKSDARGTRGEGGGNIELSNDF